MSVEATRWGIVYCPKEGVRKSQKHWVAIQKYLREKRVSYDFVQSEDKESVERLAAMLAAHGYRTIGVVGGDAALNRALNGILTVGEQVRKEVSLGVIPYGWANDFAKFWGLDEDDYKKSVDVLLAGRTRKVDVGVCKVQLPGQETQQRFFLNCVNVGLVANIMSIKHRTYRFWGMRSLSFFSSVFLLFFHRMETKMHFKLNQDEIDKQVMTVCIGNATGYGQTPSCVPYNGMLDVSVVSSPELSRMFEGLWLLLWGRFLNHKSVKAYRTRRVQFLDHGNATVSLDGTVWKDATTPMDIEVKQEWLNFIIP